MKKYKFNTTLVVLLTFLATMLTPVSASAFSIKDILSPTTKISSGESSNGLLDILIALLLGDIINRVTQAADSNSGFGAVLSALQGLSNKDNLNSLTQKIKPQTKKDALNNTNTSGASLKKGQDIINSAQKYMSVPYVWGGATPDGWDCSGFTQYVMKQNGINIARTAAEQFKAGAKISKENLQIGDMVFFTTYKPSASHVGFYLGDGRFIHASSAAKEVTVSSLDEPYFKERYLGARRYVK